MNYSFDVDLAVKIGVDESIMLNNFVFWLSKNKANNKNLFDGNYWTFNSVRAYTELFPFWKESQIKRILKSLVEQSVLVVGNYNQNAYDRTNWYSLSTGYLYLIDWTISTNGKEYNSQPIPDIKTYNKQNNRVNKFTPPSLEEIKQYIEEKDINVDAKKFFDYFEVSNWIDSKGNKVKNWKQKILTWATYNKNIEIKNSNENTAYAGGYR